jgi:hypothetical protein
VFPYGKAAGEKVPGERRAIDALAFDSFQRRPPPAPPTLPLALPVPATAPAEGALRRALLATLAAVVVFNVPGPLSRHATRRGGAAASPAARLPRLVGPPGRALSCGDGGPIRDRREFYPWRAPS